MCISLRDIRAARRRIASAVARTPCLESIPLSELTGIRVFCKLESHQRTGSFKERGARNALLQLDEQARKRGVVAASAGNHASALAYHGQLLRIPVTVVMPTFAPLIKISTCRKLGAEVILEGADFAAAHRKADTLVSNEGLTYINGYDDPAVIAGQGTIGLEILEQIPEVQAIVVPVGGGGLIAGIACAVKALRPEIEVIGVSSIHTPGFSTALRRGHPALTSPQSTLADGLAVPECGSNAFALAHHRIDRFVSVSEDLIALAILRFLELEKDVVEGAAAATLAALLGGNFLT